MYNHLLYFTYWLFNSAVLYGASALFPSEVVLGNWRFGGLESAIYAGFWETFFIWVLWDFALAKGVKFDSGVVTFGYFWTANIFAFWLVSRFSEYAGLGITSYLWALTLGLVAYLMQRFAWRIVVGKKAV